MLSAMLRLSVRVVLYVTTLCPCCPLCYDSLFMLSAMLRLPARVVRYVLSFLREWSPGPCFAAVAVCRLLRRRVESEAVAGLTFGWGRVGKGRHAR